MEKIKFTVNLKGNDENYHYSGKGILKEGIMHYYEDKIKVTFSIKEPIFLKREHEDYLLEFYFKPNEKKSGTYLIKRLNRKIPLETFTKKIEKELEKIEIVYDLILDQEPVEYKFLLEYEVLE